jgi:hypothetical protein
MPRTNADPYALAFSFSFSFSFPLSFSLPDPHRCADPFT